MEVSESEDDLVRKKSRKDDPLATLRDDNDDLRCQVEAYKNEMDVVRSDYKVELENKDKQLKIVQQTLQSLQQQLLEGRRRQQEDELKILELQAKLKTKKLETKNDVETSAEGEKDKENTENEVEATDPVMLLQSKLSEKEAKLIGLIAIFLHVHPFGASVDYVWSFLQKLEPSLRPLEVEQLMAKFTSVFQQELSGIGANMERRWVFEGFKNNFI